VAVGGGGDGDPRATTVHDDDRFPRVTVSQRRDRAVDRLDKSPGVGHPRVEGHDIQVICVAGKGTLPGPSFPGPDGPGPSSSADETWHHR
jgi:hypothetical protein